MKKVVLIISVIMLLGCSGNKKENKETVKDVFTTKSIVADNNEVMEKVEEQMVVESGCKISDTLKVLFTELDGQSLDVSLANILDVVLANENAFSNECAVLTLEDWFTDKATYSFIELIKKKDKLEESFNGFKYLDRYSVVFKNNAELSEAISEELALLAKRNPYKFINYIESLEVKEERESVLSKPFWNQTIYQSMKGEIDKSKYKNEIISFLKNSG